MPQVSEENNGITKILAALDKARNGLTVRMLFIILGDTYEELTSVRVSISIMKRQGLVYSDGNLCCSECKSESTCYRISEQGRIKLHNRIERLNEKAQLPHSTKKNIWRRSVSRK